MLYHCLVWGLTVAVLVLLTACDSGPAPKAQTTPPSPPATDTAAAPDGATLLAQGLAAYRDANSRTPSDRSAQGALYQQAITALEQAKSHLPPTQQSLELYQTLWNSYRDLAYLPVTFEQGVHPDHGVVPTNMQQMRQAQAVFAEAKALFPNDPGVAPAIEQQLQNDADALFKVYAANAERQWNELNQTAGYRRVEPKSDP